MLLGAAAIASVTLLVLLFVGPGASASRPPQFAGLRFSLRLDLTKPTWAGTARCTHSARYAQWSSRRVWTQRPSAAGARLDLSRVVEFTSAFGAAATDESAFNEPRGQFFVRQAGSTWRVPFAPPTGVCASILFESVIVDYDKRRYAIVWDAIPDTSDADIPVMEGCGTVTFRARTTRQVWVDVVLKRGSAYKQGPIGARRCKP